jgi:hypothetical protein
MKNKFLLFLGLIFLTCNISASVINLHFPADKLYTDDTTPAFNFTPVGVNATYVNCEVQLKRCGTGWVSFTTPANVNNNTMTQQTATNTGYYDYKWRVQCNDSVAGTIITLSAERDINIGKSNYRAMDLFAKFISDFIGFFPKLITLIIYGVIIGLVVYVGAWIKGSIKR